MPVDRLARENAKIDGSCDGRLSVGGRSPPPTLAWRWASGNGHLTTHVHLYCETRSETVVLPGRTAAGI